MKRLLLSVSMVVLLGTPVIAADMVDVATVHDWSGLYLGLNAGYGFGGDDAVGIDYDPGAAYTDVANLDVSGFFGGLQAGWNLQHGNWLFGVEGDLQFADIDDDFGETIYGPDHRASGSSDIDFFGTARLRGGWAIDRLLIYGTGGLAWANVDYDVRTVAANGDTANMSSDNIELGYAIGGGAEFAIDESWSVKAEYLYIGLGSEDVTGSFRNGAGALTGATATTVMTPSFHTVRIGVNWQF